MFNSGTHPTTQIGYVSEKKQKNHGHRNVPGTDHLQTAYKLECLNCGETYGANGSDIFQRKCPKCQDGVPGIEY
jgi:hypothetical protein